METEYKKRSSNSNFVNDENFNHAKLEEFLNNHEDVEIYYRDGMFHFLVISRGICEMRNPAGLQLAYDLKEKFKGEYNIEPLLQHTHSGYVWRHAFRLTGGYSDVYKEKFNNKTREKVNKYK